MIRSLRNIKEKTGKILEWTLAFIFFSLIFVVGIQILSRFLPILFLSKQMFSTELTSYLLVYLTFFGAALATKRNEHLNISFLLESLSERSQLIIKYFNRLIYLLVAIVLGIISFNAMLCSVRLGTMCDTIPVPVWIIYAVFPLAFVLMTLFTFIDIILELNVDYNFKWGETD